MPPSGRKMRLKNVQINRNVFTESSKMNRQTSPTFKFVDVGDLQVDLALVDELRFGGVLAADLALDSCLWCGGLQVTLGSCRSLFRLAPC